LGIFDNASRTIAMLPRMTRALLENLPICNDMGRQVRFVSILQRLARAGHAKSARAGGSQGPITRSDAMIAAPASRRGSPRAPTPSPTVTRRRRSVTAGVDRRCGSKRRGRSTDLGAATSGRLVRIVGLPSSQERLVVVGGRSIFRSARLCGRRSTESWREAGAPPVWLDSLFAARAPARSSIVNVTGSAPRSAIAATRLRSLAVTAPSPIPRPWRRAWRWPQRCEPDRRRRFRPAAWR
jgi:hypothetical protein